MIEYYLLIGLAIMVVSCALIFFNDRFYHWLGKHREGVKSQSSASLKEIMDRDRQIKKLNVRINELVELNSRYLSFIFNAPSIMQRLNTTVNLQEIVLSIIELANNVAVTDKVDIFLFDATRNHLNKVSGNDELKQEQITYALGEGLIGIAAEKRFVMMREHYTQRNGNRDAQEKFSIAVPLICKDNLLGVLGIGEIKNRIGNESDLIKMIADIAAVALFNQLILSDAQHKANTDPLTRLNNRNYFSQMVQYNTEKSSKDGTEISIFLFDIDSFKNYNDTNGHAAGDKLLIELSRLIRGSSRKNSTIARYGGEEFIIMLPGISKEEAFIYAERLRVKVSQHPFHHGEKQPLGFVSISGGVASFPGDGDSIDSVIQHADESLYQAKSEGRNRVLLYRSQQLKSNDILERA
jgi:diguanylate cyclase (GGDEF)-like protein